jgi:hypothetical protein
MPPADVLGIASLTHLGTPIPSLPPQGPAHDPFRLGQHGRRCAVRNKSW